MITPEDIESYFRTKLLVYASKKAKDFFEGKSGKTFLEVLEDHVVYESFANLAKAFTLKENELEKILVEMPSIELIRQDNKSISIVRFLEGISHDLIPKQG